MSRSFRRLWHRRVLWTRTQNRTPQGLQWPWCNGSCQGYQYSPFLKLDLPRHPKYCKKAKKNLWRTWKGWMDELEEVGMTITKSSTQEKRQIALTRTKIFSFQQLQPQLDQHWCQRAGWGFFLDYQYCKRWEHRSCPKQNDTNGLFLRPRCLRRGGKSPYLQSIW